MKIVEVIPISRGIHKDTLSYFTSENVEPGTILKVPLRGRDINALVLSSGSLSEQKQQIKDSAFELKKASQVVTENLLSEPFMNAVEKTADFHATSIGSLLFSILPLGILDQAKSLTIPKQKKVEEKKSHGLVLQASDEERFGHYRSIIREEFAKKKSVFMCVPTTSDIERVRRLLEKGIGEYSFIFHSKIKKKDLVKQWNELVKESHPVLIIGTGSFLCIPRQDIGTIIIERENSSSYKSISRPYTDIRTFVEFFGKQIGARMIFGDVLLRTETVYRYRHDELGELSPPSMRVLSPAEQILVDMTKTQKGSAHFELISKELKELIRRTKENNERLVMFCNRRGLSPITVCGDCGASVECKRCRAPVVLHTVSNKRQFICHRCGETRSADEKCKNCTSWRLKALGIGTELVYEEVKSQFPNLTLFRIDSDSVKNHKQALKIAEQFYESPGSVLVGTEMAFLYLDQKIENAAIASIDSMFSMPDFRIREKVLSILFRLRSLTTKNFLIQSRNSEEPTFDYVLKGNLIDFYKKEIEERESFDYPPLTVFIKISISGTKEAVEAEMEKLKDEFLDYDINIYPAFIPHAKGVYTMNALIKIGKKRWVEPNLLSKLRSLPPQFSIAVDPENIL